MNSFFVTGTDTDVGKTCISAAIAKHLRDNGVDVGVMKPFASGYKATADSVSGDVEILMKYSGAKRLDKMVLWGADFSGAKAVPGDYIVKLKVNEKELTQDFTIHKDPTSEGSIEDIKAQFEFVNEINGVVADAHNAIENIRKIKNDLNKFQSDYADNESAKNLINESKLIFESIDLIENELYQTKNQSNQDPLNYGVKLTNNLGNLNSAFRGGDFGPTAQDIMVKNELIKKVNIQLEKYNSIISEDIPEFNSKFKNLELDYLNVFM